jgi:hypothetical protein
MEYTTEDHGQGVWSITTDEPGPALARFLGEHQGHEIQSTYGYQFLPPTLTRAAAHKIVITTRWPHDEQV